MARGINKVIILGNLGSEPDARQMPNGNAVTNISIATGRSWRDKESQEMIEKTEWHRVVFFGRIAEIASQYLKKGSRVYVEGRLQTRKWQDKDGNDRWTTEIVANEMQMLGEGGGIKGGSEFTPEESHEFEAPKKTNGGSEFDPEFDDDVPF